MKASVTKIWSLLFVTDSVDDLIEHLNKHAEIWLEKENRKII
jgi:hypothetical protein